MKKSNASSRSTFPTHQLLAHLVVHQRLRQAADSPDCFLEFCFTDSTNTSLRQSTIHRELQAFLSQHRKALIELPRDHGKSVQVCARVLWELGHNPALRVKLVCATDSLAAERSRFLRECIESNPRVALTFPSLVRREPWTAEAFTIDRLAHVIGPSVAALGVGAAATGTRADLLICDDIVDVRSLHSRADRERVKEYFHNNLMNLLEPDGRFWGLCTPWHPDDLNAHLKTNPAYAVFRRAVGPNLESVWPEKWPPDKLAARLKEIGAASFARGYRLQPIAESQITIPTAWVHFWCDAVPRSDYEAVVLSVDPAVSAKASADQSALVVLGRHAGNVDCLAALGQRVSTPDLVTLIDEFDHAWQPDAILFESNAAFAGIRDLLIRHTRFGLRIQGVTQTRSKAARIAAFSVTVQNGLLRLRGDSPHHVHDSQRDLFEQMTTFPFAPHDDLIDATATGTEFLFHRREPRIWT